MQPDFFDRYDAEDEPDDRATCSRCGASGLHWAALFLADGSESRVLFTENARKHVCPPPSADDFGVVT